MKTSTSCCSPYKVVAHLCTHSTNFQNALHLLFSHITTARELSIVCKMNEYPKLKKFNIHNVKVRFFVDIRIISVVAVLSTLLSLWHLQVFNNHVHQIRKPHYSKFEFAISALNLLQKDKPNDNVFYSPHSVYQALSLTYSIAAGETKKDLAKVLGLVDWVESKAEVEHRYKFENDLRIKISK